MRIFVMIAVFVLCTHAQESYKFGVFPHMPLKKLHAVYSVVTMDLQKRIGKPVILMSRPYYRLYEEELERGLYDIAFVQPLDYINAHNKQGYIPLARRSEDLKAIMVVPRASSFQKVEDVKEKIIASAPASAAVTNMMLKSLEDRGFQVLEDFTLSYSKNHFICLQKVVDNKASACITARRAMEFYEQVKGYKSFKVIYETTSLPHSVMVVHPRVSPEIRELIKRRILSWGEDKEGQALLNNGRMLEFIEAKDEDYDPVRKFLNIRE